MTTHYIHPRPAAGLPQVLADNSRTYLYGLGAAAERAAGWSYYLRDGLGSLRQVVNGSAETTLERSYTPWGDVLTQSGAINPAQGYLGSWVNAATGRFLLRHSQTGFLSTQ